MFTGLGRFAHRRRWWVLAGALVFAVFAVVWGTGVFGQVSDGGFVDPDAESSRAAELLTEELGTGSADVVLVYRDAGGVPRQGDRVVDDPRFAGAVTFDLDGLPDTQVTSVTGYYHALHLHEFARRVFVSQDGNATYAVLTLAGATDEEKVESYAAIADRLTDSSGQLADSGIRAFVGGTTAMQYEMSEKAEHDIVRAELYSLPILLVLLVAIFGGLVAASLPVAIGVLAILGSFTLLHALAHVTEISVFAVNVATILGLGLAIDYGLFLVSRFREELRRTGDTAAALPGTLASAGRTIAFSGVTVVIAFCGLLFFPQPMLRSIGLGGIAVVLFDMLAALVVLPALLAVVGPRIDRLRFPWPRRRRPPAHATVVGTWERVARAVMRRPGLNLAVVAMVLVAFGLPLLSTQPGITDQRYLPTGEGSRVVSDMLGADFPGGWDSVDVVVVGPVTEAALDGFAARLDAVDGASRVDVQTHDADLAHLAVAYRGEADDAATAELVRAVRVVEPPVGAEEVLVGGFAALNVDNLDALGASLPWTLLFVVAVTLVFLFLAFGSLVLPVKAVLMGMLSLGASLGVVVWGFQEGGLGGLLGFPAVGTVDPTYLIIILVVAFGLAMDYELFLLSRVREEYLATGDNAASVAHGLQYTGSIITSAALLLVVVLAAMGTSDLVFLQLVGLGLTVAVLVDATLVRAILVPATMRLLGEVNWWLPAPLRRLHDRVGLREGEEETPAAATRERELTPVA